MTFPSNLHLAVSRDRGLQFDAEQICLLLSSRFYPSPHNILLSDDRGYGCGRSACP